MLGRFQLFLIFLAAFQVACTDDSDQDQEVAQEQASQDQEVAQEQASQEQVNEEHENQDNEGNNEDQYEIAQYLRGPSLGDNHMEKIHSLWDANKDGKASIDEVVDFAAKAGLSEARRNIEKALENLDESKDGKLSLEEVMKGEVESGNLTASTDLDMGFVNDQFQKADLNGDGVLEGDELQFFYHPETHEASLKRMAEERVGTWDKDGDGKLTEEEFVDYVDDGDDDVMKYHQHFKELDKSGDGHVDASELVHWESGQHHLEDSMKQLFDDADVDKDGGLTVKELQNAPDHHKNVGSSSYAYLSKWAGHEGDL